MVSIKTNVMKWIKVRTIMITIPRAYNNVLQDAAILNVARPIKDKNNNNKTIKQIKRDY